MFHANYHSLKGVVVLGHRIGQCTTQVPEHAGARDGWQLTAVTRSMSSGKVCMKFMTLSLTGSLSTPPSCTGDAGEGRKPLAVDSEEEKTLEA